jgi:chaperonin GroEL (HSP60 family)
VKLEQIDFVSFGRCIRVTVDEFETNILSKSNEVTKNAVIYVGSSSETETMEVYDKAIDALNSVRSAQKEGVVPGGGISYLRIS